MKQFNVVVLGMTDRPQTINVVKAIAKNSDHKLKGVILEKRFSRRLKSVQSIKKMFTGFGWRFIARRLKEFLLLKLNKLTNKREEIHSYLDKKSVPYIEVDNINDSVAEQFLRRQYIDVIVLAGAPIIKNNILDCANKMTINVHRSLLPKYAGLDALFWALYYNENKVGATVHTVNEKIDAGKIILQKEKEVEKNDTVETLTKWYYQAAPQLVVESLDLISDPDFKFKNQDFSQREYFSWPTKEQRIELEERLKNGKKV